MARNILTVFAGRRKNIELLSRYLRRALEQGTLHEVHFWDYTRNAEDSAFLRSVSNLKRTSGADGGRYVRLATPVVDNAVDVRVRAASDAHIKILCGVREYEIVLGGWDNTKCAIRLAERTLYEAVHENVMDAGAKIGFRVSIVAGRLRVLREGALLIDYALNESEPISTVWLKTGHRSPGEVEFRATENARFFYMDPCERGWKDYYEHYAAAEYRDDVIVKCDDDICFIDLNVLPRYLAFARSCDLDLVFANTINNGVSAFYQQHMYKLIPSSLMQLEYPPEGLCGSLWESGSKADALHRHFVSNHTEFRSLEYRNRIIPVKTRYSINFFAFKGRDWPKVADCYRDDEHELTVKCVKERGFRNAIYPGMFVSHLSFYRQVETGIDLEGTLKLYESFADAELGADA